MRRPSQNLLISYLFLMCDGIIMSNQKAIKLSYEKSYNFIYYLNQRNDLKLELDRKKNLVTAYDNLFERVLEFRFPLAFPVI